MVGCRRLWTLIEGLPLDSQVWEAARDRVPSEPGTARQTSDDRPVLSSPAEFHQFMAKVVGGGG